MLTDAWQRCAIILQREPQQNDCRQQQWAMGRQQSPDGNVMSLMLWQAQQARGGGCKKLIVLQGTRSELKHAHETHQHALSVITKR